MIVDHSVDVFFAFNDLGIEGFLIALLFAYKRGNFHTSAMPKS